MATALIVDDEPGIVERARLYLEQDGFRVETAGDGQAGPRRLTEPRPDLVILDLMLPGLDGFGVCREIRRQSNTPIQMLTARAEDVDKIVGLELAADDYLTKPFNPRELSARAKAILRRTQGGQRATRVLELADVRLDLERHEVTVAGLARWLGQPLGRLLAATQAMARGDYSRRVEPGGPPELVRLAESFNEMSAEVERSRALVSRFVSTLSHELRTPLTAIRGFAQAVLDGSAASPKAVQRAMRVVDREARRMQRLSSELLDLSRLQAGQVPMRREPLDLGELIRHCAEVLEVRAQDQRVRLALDLPVGLLVNGDADRLEQVFTNLLDNALKFRPRGQAIQVRGQPRGQAAGPGRAATGGEPRRFGRARTPPPSVRPGVLVEIANPGPPIPAHELPRIFEQFYTGGEGRQRGGSGLGLPIAREISRAHGGDLTVTSEPEPTTFRLWLPASAERRDDAVTPEPLTRTPVR